MAWKEKQEIVYMDLFFNKKSTKIEKKFSKKGKLQKELDKRARKN